MAALKVKFPNGQRQCFSLSSDIVGIHMSLPYRIGQEHVFVLTAECTGEFSVTNGPSYCTRCDAHLTAEALSKVRR